MIRHQIVVREQKWKLEFASRHPLLPARFFGRCDPGSKTMVVRKSLKGKMSVDTLIHEFTHAYFQDLTEDSVNQFATQLSEVLALVGLIDDHWQPQGKRKT